MPENLRFEGYTNNGQYSLELDTENQLIHLQIRNNKDPELLSGTINEWFILISQALEFMRRLNSD